MGQLRDGEARLATPAPGEVGAAWDALTGAVGAARGRRIVDMFGAEPDRLERLTLDAAGLHLDLSKQAWTLEGLDAALALARACGVEEARARLFGGERVNRSEGRAVLHPALRAPEGARFRAGGEAVSGDVEAVREAMREFAEGVRTGAVLSAAGRPFRTIINIGIGGSDLGPRLVHEALRALDGWLELRFASNVDGHDIAAALHGLDPAETLVVVVSKTFTTQETMANAAAARDWLRAGLGKRGDQHLAAVSAAPEAAAKFGVSPDRVFAFRDWVGGRFSVWSPVGLSCAARFGWARWSAFLDGAAAMDRHFVETPLERNAPVLMALAQVFNANGLGRRARAVVPYAQRLRLLPAFLQQLEMESNGKSVTADGKPVPRPTAPAVFGDAGTNGQHAFFQLLHQGTDVIPVDFIGVARSEEGPEGAQTKLLANLLAQAEALMIGRPEAEVRRELEAKGLDRATLDELAPQRTFPGDRPSTLILMERLTPEALGALLALYEHKTFVEGVLWGINSFDQWGVELGKVLAGRILPELEGAAEGAHDPSTAALIARLRG
ncbi:MAG: glucose-6-phosphate isomerase [Proteobacteria bacterium]|nr:glucose-6-phosphate isomerase [Pseudomonadota bacterium]